jgi:di/tricarboxylate transporter
MQKHGGVIQERLGHVRLEFGDTLLLRGFKPALNQLKHTAGLIVTEELKMEEFRTDKAPLALAIVLTVVLSATMGVSILTAALAGCILMVFTGCLKMTELHSAIRMDVLFLLAGVIPLGIMLERTGAAALLAHTVAQLANFLPPLLILMMFTMMSALLTELISHSATVIVMGPVAISTAILLGYDPRAFMLAVMFAASTSFSTPVGYQTNTMIYGPGGYKFLDFLRVGGPLNLTLSVVTPIFIYFIWGL